MGYLGSGTTAVGTTAGIGLQSGTSEFDQRANFVPYPMASLSGGGDGMLSPQHVSSTMQHQHHLQHVQQQHRLLQSSVGFGPQSNSGSASFAQVEASRAGAASSSLLGRGGGTILESTDENYFGSGKNVSGSRLPFQHMLSTAHGHGHPNMTSSSAAGPSTRGYSSLLLGGQPTGESIGQHHTVHQFSRESAFGSMISSGVGAGGGGGSGGSFLGLTGAVHSDAGGLSSFLDDGHFGGSLRNAYSSSDAYNSFGGIAAPASSPSLSLSHSSSSFGTMGLPDPHAPPFVPKRSSS